MRQLFLDKGSIVIKEVCEPILEKNNILVSVEYSWISSGTEMATIHAQKSLFSRMPEKISKVLSSVHQHGFDSTKLLIREKLKGTVMPLGYSCSGRVLAVGSAVKTFRAGDLVACAGAEIANHADVISVPHTLVAPVTDEQYLKHASITTIGSIALQGIRQSGLQIGETVCVIGLGLLGQITTQLASLSGCTVIGIDPQQSRRDLALQLGATNTYDPADNCEADIIFATGGFGVDCTIITAASSEHTIIQQAMNITRKKGKVVLVGDVGLQLERNPFYQKEIELRISCSYGPGRYDVTYEEDGIDYPFAYVRWTENRNMRAFITLIEAKKLNIETLISKTVSIEYAHEAYEYLQTHNALGIILTYPAKKTIVIPATSEKTPDVSYTKPLAFIPARSKKLRIGIIGAGGFAKVHLMPIMSRMKNISIDAIVDPRAAQAITSSRLFKGARALTNDDELFKTDLVDAVIISSPHAFHSTQAFNALHNGKAVFLEKPMVTSFEQLAAFNRFFTDHPQAPFCVDYNRSFSPLITDIKETIKNRSTPLMIQYRMNAGFIPKTHWVQREVGAGRIIGEACHIFDLFYHLTDSHAISVSVESLKPKDDNLFPTDNFSASISFQDGSVCTLFYTSLGHPGLSKERMEVYYNSKAIVLKDYKTVCGYGLPHSFGTQTPKPIKGHQQLLQTFFDRIQTPPYIPPISFKRLHDVAYLTLAIDQLACQGGGVKVLES